MPDEHTAITSLASLEAALEELHCSFSGEAMWWRGQAVASWPLKPHVYRDPPKQEGQDGKKYVEHALINHFQMRALGRLGHRLSPLNDLEWMFLAQHYGLPTRLLDWTENPFVAIYFAVFDKSHDKDVEDSCLWTVSPSELNKHESNPANPSEAQVGLIYSNEKPVQAMVMQAFGTKCGVIAEKTGLCSSTMPKVLALASGDTDERIVAQAGRFTLHGCGDALECFALKDKYLRKFLIPKDAKKILRQRLDSMGIRRWSLFPDLQSLAEGLKYSDFAMTGSKSHVPEGA